MKWKPKRNENFVHPTGCTQMYVAVWLITTHTANNQKGPSAVEWINKLFRSYREKLLSNKRERTTDTPNHTDDSRWHGAKSECRHKNGILYDYIYMKLWKIQNLTLSGMVWRHWLQMGTRELSGDGIVLYVGGSGHHTIVYLDQISSLTIDRFNYMLYSFPNAL